jgi:hypothetical protein
LGIVAAEALAAAGDTEDVVVDVPEDVEVLAPPPFVAGVVASPDTIAAGVSMPKKF